MQRDCPWGRWTPEWQGTTTPTGTGGQAVAAAGSGSGDPYLAPYLLGGQMVKLPNRGQCYRLLEVGELRVNARVGQLDSAGRTLITEVLGDEAEAGGYFFTEFVVRTAHSLVHLDGDLGVISIRLQQDGLQWEEEEHETRSHVCPVQGLLTYTKTVRLGLPGSGGVELKKYVHPQVRNGVGITFCRDPRGVVKGLLLDGDDRRARLLTRKGVMDTRPLRSKVSGSNRKKQHGKACKTARNLPKESWMVCRK